MTEDFQADARDALARASEYIASAVRHASPTAKAAESWHLHRRGDHVNLTSRDMGMVMSESAGTSNPLGYRHPVFAHGPRDEWAWVPQNVNHPDRTHAAERAVYEAADYAAEMFAEDLLQRIVIDMPGR